MKIKIYFGEVKSVEDDQKLFRCRVSINGHTNEIETENLPWYYPWYGVNFLPRQGDIVPIIIFDDNFASGFYGRVIKINSSELSDDDYADYLEIYNRDDVKLIYTVTNGIEFVNEKSGAKIEKDKLTWFTENNSITITDDLIKIGKNAEQFNILGDKGQELFKDLTDNLHDLINNLVTNFTTMATTAGANPYTSPLGVNITALVTILQTMATTVAALKPKYNPNVLQSKMTKIQ